MQATADPVIKFDNVEKSFGSFTAVDGISFSATPGETLALLGPSGCGKTTTLRLIAGFEEPDKGAIEISGQSMAGKRPYERNVGLLFQHYALFPHMSVRENVAYGLKHRGWPKAEIGDRVAAMLRLVQLEGLADRRPQQMSGGQQQRVALARVLATEPKLVLLDEPLSALDAKLREELRVELKQILAAVGSTTIVVTHDQDEAMSLADRIIVMNRGRIEQQGIPDDIYSRPASSFVATFIGRTNWFHGTISRAKPGSFARVVTAAGTVLTVSDPGIEDDREVSVCVRPERLTVAMAEAKRSGSDANQLPGTVTEMINMGAGLYYNVDSAIGPLTVIEPNRGGTRFAKGDKVCIGFRAEDCVVLPGRA
jgi:putative spermidine/putrescine transport system ATP-binding protein